MLIAEEAVTEFKDFKNTLTQQIVCFVNTEATLTRVFDDANKSSNTSY